MNTFVLNDSSDGVAVNEKAKLSIYLYDTYIMWAFVLNDSSVGVAVNGKTKISDTSRSTVAVTSGNTLFHDSVYTVLGPAVTSQNDSMNGCHRNESASSLLKLNKSSLVATQDGVCSKQSSSHVTGISPERTDEVFLSLHSEKMESPSDCHSSYDKDWYVQKNCIKVLRYGI